MRKRVERERERERKRKKNINKASKDYILLCCVEETV